MKRPVQNKRSPALGRALPFACLVYLLGTLLVSGLGAAPTGQGQDDLLEGLDVFKEEEKEAQATDADRKKKPTYRTFSLGFSAGIAPDMGGQSQALLQEGLWELAPDTLARQYWSTKHLIPAYKDSRALAYNSSKTSSPMNLVESATEPAAPLGFQGQVDLQLEFYDPVFSWPFFLRGGFNYGRVFLPVETDRVLGSVSEDSSGLSLLLEQNQLDPAGYSGGKMSVRYSAGWVEVPMQLGIKFPVFVRSYIYGAAGVSYSRGGFQYEIEMDAAYANVLASRIDSNQNITNANPLKAGESLKETIAFIHQGLGINYLFGLQYMLGDNTGLFIEWTQLWLTRSVYSSPLSEKGRAIFTAALGPENINQPDGDDHWVKRLAGKLELGGSALRLGLRSYLF